MNIIEKLKEIATYEGSEDGLQIFSKKFDVDEYEDLAVIDGENWVD